MIVRLLHDAVRRPRPFQPGRTLRCAEALRERGGLAPPLIPPLLSPHAEADVGMCAKAYELQVPGLGQGLVYGVEGADAKMKPGVIGKAAGDEARFVDTSRSRSRSLSSSSAPDLYEHMGQVFVQCEGECGEEGPIDAHVEGGKFSVFKARTLNLRKVKPAAGGGRASRPRLHRQADDPREDGERRAQVQGAIADDGGSRGKRRPATRRASTTGRRARTW